MDPSTGTFISSDSYSGSTGNPISLHKYLYANANPVSYSDPSGYAGSYIWARAMLSVLDFVFASISLYEAHLAFIEGEIAEGVALTALGLLGMYSSYSNAMWAMQGVTANATNVAATAEGGSSETSYAQSSLKLLINTDNFTDSAIEHIFEGQVNVRGKAVGYHYEGIESTAGNAVPGTELLANEFGVYKAQVEVNGIPKTAKGGFSTFFPKDMSPQQVVSAINEAYGNRVLVEGSRNTYQGVSNSGIKINMFIDESGNIISAFPER